MDIPLSRLFLHTIGIASLILESDDELEGARPGGRSRHAQTLKQERRAPKRYEKLYLVTV